MKHVKAEMILPGNLVREVQKYVQGEYLYIPSKLETRRGWGEKSGSRVFLENRNKDIRRKYASGYNITDLADEFFLSIDSIKKIIYTKE